MWARPLTSEVGSPAQMGRWKNMSHPLQFFAYNTIILTLIGVQNVRVSLIWNGTKTSLDPRSSTACDMRTAEASYEEELDCWCAPRRLR